MLILCFYSTLDSAIKIYLPNVRCARFQSNCKTFKQFVDRKSQNDEQSAQGSRDVIASINAHWHVAVLVATVIMMVDFQVLKKNCNI